MATTTRRRKNTLTKFIEDIVDNTKDLVDDLIDRSRDLEDDLRRTARNVVDDDSPSSDELQDLKKALAELTSKVNQLAETKAGSK
ncbi:MULTISPECIES: hypothetical protein [unclassified Frankia]|uniref:hypothetical protein n=1 Tax=unclassified Frankia TaxID=2632575 RepID=UPI002023C30F